MNRLAEIIFNKSIDEVSVESLEQLTNKYPFFSAGHLLVMEKKQKENLPSAFSQKASLHFHPLLFNESSIVNNQLSATSSSPQVVLEPISIPQPVLLNEEPIATEAQIEISKEEIEITEAPQPTELSVHVNSDNTDQQQEITNEPITSNEEPATNTESLAFEPFHTVDYFASQGIKFKIDENPTDKFSKQLKSFTEWLKTMKKLPTGEIVTASAPVASVEQKVEQLAEISLTKAEVITEAMAEVWEKQGNPEKAIEIYEKLSLLEPSKSPYFATRISGLKKTN